MEHVWIRFTAFFLMACDLERIKHLEKTLGTTLLFSGALSGLGEAEKTGICPKESPKWSCAAILWGRHLGNFAAPTLLVSPTQDQEQILSRRKRMDRLWCSSAIYQRMVTDAITGRILKEAPRLHSVTEAIEIKKKKFVLKLCFFHFSYCHFEIP